MSDLLLNHHSRQPKVERTIVGLIPAAGQATRLHPLPFSKELYPIGCEWHDKLRNPHPKPVCVSLLEKMRHAGAIEAFIVLRDGKWDIPSYLSHGGMLRMNLAYLMMGLPYGVPFTLDQAYPFVREATIVFGFPDILFSPEDAFVTLISKLNELGSDAALGLFPVSTPGQMDEVNFESSGRINKIHIKPAEMISAYTWIIAAWAPSFTLFLHEFVSKVLKENDPTLGNLEICFSDVMNAAIESGMKIDGVIAEGGYCLDIGTPENLKKALHQAFKMEDNKAG